VDPVPPPLLARPDPAPVPVRDAVYRSILARLDLSQAHREALRRRGLPDLEIDRRGYRTWPDRGPARWRLARRIAEVHGPEALAVPGVTRRTARSGREYVDLCGPAGLAIPVRDLDGRILAVVIRRDVSGDTPAKYVWLSSVPDGPGPGTPAHVPLARLDGHATGVVRIVEGILKSDVTQCLDPARIRTVGVPGATVWRVALPVLAALRPRTVRIALDMDWTRNPHVARALVHLSRALRGQGYDIEVVRW
jgi:hypothetical protein